MGGYPPQGTTGAIALVGIPIAKLGRYLGTDQTYQTVVSWTVTSGKIGELREVSMESDTYSKTHFKLSIGGTVQFEDKTIMGPLSLPFPGNLLASGTVVLLECKSTDGTAIIVDGSITGREV